MSRCTTQFAKTPDTLDFSYDEAPLQPAVAQAYKQNTTFDTYGQLQGQLQLPKWPPTNSRLMPVSDSVNTASAPYPPVDTNEYTEFMNPREMFLSGPIVDNYDDELGPPLDVEAAQETALSMVREEEEEEEQEEEQQEEEEQEEQEEAPSRASCSKKKKKQYNVWLILFLFALSVLALVLIVQFFRYVYQN